MEECLRKKLVEMIRLATLAPSPYNTQPWKFSITSREIQIHPDLSRHLSVMDPEKRELYISLGCALENLTIAMENQGFNPQVRYHLGQDFDEHLKATFRNGKKGNNSILFNAISKRRSNPSFLDSRPISMQDQNLLLSLPLEEGVAVHWLNSQQELQTIRDIARTAIQSQKTNKFLLEEFVRWWDLKKSEKEENRNLPFLRPLFHMSSPTWLNSFFLKHFSAVNRVRTTSTILLFTAKTDTKETWIKVGRSFERLALRACSLGIQYSHLNQPLQSTTLRSQIRKKLGLQEEIPQFMICLGHSKPLPVSAKRPVDDMIIETFDTLFSRPTLGYETNDEQGVVQY